jgi:hypothetical protein
MRSTRWLAFVVALFAAVGTGIVTYNLGLSHGAAQAAAAAGTLPPYPYAWGWHYGWGFGGFPIFFLLFFWLIVARIFFWGGPWRRRWYGYSDVPPSFEAWHRRAHERMTQEPPTHV